MDRGAEMAWFKRFFGWIFRKRRTARHLLPAHSMAEKTAIVTGATSGIGLETVRALAASGMQVVLAVRNTDAGARVRHALTTALELPSHQLEVQHLDLSDLESVRVFAQKWGDRPLHLLVNNAGVMGIPESYSPQGFELQLATNHLGHFELTRALLPALVAGAPSRILVLSSSEHKRGNPDRLRAKLQKNPFTYERYQSYTDSKLANLLFTKALAQRLPPQVEVFGVHPGIVATPIARGIHPIVGRWYARVGGLLAKSPAEGAVTSIYAAFSSDIAGQSGAYLADAAIATPCAHVQNTDLAEEIWTLSERAVGGRWADEA